MSQRRHVTLVAGGATLLAALPLSTVFERWTWLVDVLIVVGVSVGVAVLVRSFRVPLWAPVLAMAAAFVTILSWVFSSGHELAGLIPTPATFRHWNDLLLSAGQDMRDFGVPVEDREGLLFLAALGVGLVAIVVDLCAVVLRRPAMAGLPMLAIYSVPVAVNNGSVNFLTFGASAAGFLWLLVTDNVDRVRRFGRRFTGDGRDVDLWEPSPLSAAGRRLALVGVLLAVTLPLAVPGMTTGLLDRFGTGAGDGPSGGPGGSRGSVNLFAELHGQLNLKRAYDMIKVQTNDPNPYYLRFGTADQLQTDGFRNRPPVGGQPVTGNLPSATLPATPGMTQRQYHAAVTVINFDMRLLPIYVQPTRTERLDAAWFFDQAGAVIYSNRSTTRNRRYSFDYVRTEYTPRALRTSNALDSNNPIQRQYTQVPHIGVVDALVDKLIAGKTTQYDRVRAIYAYFSKANGFSYSLQTKPGTSGSDIVDFLDKKQGFCEQYSAALAWLVRAAHIPARVAFGFANGNARNGDTYTLNNFNLHAWTEVYFDKFGWVPFDATPGLPVVGSVSPEWAPNPYLPAPTPSASSSGGANSGPGQDPGGVPPPIDRGNEPFGTGGGGLKTKSPLERWPFWFGVGAFALLAVLAVPGLARVMRRRRRRPEQLRAGAGPEVAIEPGELRVTDERATEAARRQAHAAWDEFVDVLVDHRLPVDRSASPRNLAERVVTIAVLRDTAVDGVRLLGRVEERARYARHPLYTDGLTDELTGALRAVRRAIARRVSRRTRLVAVFFPPSVTQRWRAAVSRTAVAFTVGAGRRWDAVLASLNPRRLLPGRSSAR